LLSFHLKVKVVENLISSGIEDRAFGPVNLREHFPEEELTLGKNRFLEDLHVVYPHATAGTLSPTQRGIFKIVLPLGGNVARFWKMRCSCA